MKTMMQLLFCLLLIQSVLLANEYSNPPTVVNYQSSSNLLRKMCGTCDYLSEKTWSPRPPNGPKYVDTTHFRIHFDTTGYRPVTRANAESIAVFAEYAWTTLSNQGWIMPPPDDERGGDSRYDIYLDTGNFAGECDSEFPYPDPYPEGVGTFIILNYYQEGWSYYEGIKDLFVHEFTHASQFRYSLNEGAWFYENTSVCNGDLLTNDPGIAIVLNRHAVHPLNHPEYKITSEIAGYEYPGALWAKFLVDYYDPAGSTRILQRIWQLAGEHVGRLMIKDIDSILSIYYDSDLVKAMGHYAIWRYFCGSRDDGLHFEEGLTYPDAVILRTHSNYPTLGDQDTSYPSGPGGCNFIRFTNFGDNLITIIFRGLYGYEWAAYVIGRSGNNSREYKILLDPVEDTGSITIPGWEYTEIVLIPVVTQWSSLADSLTYLYLVTRNPALEVPADGCLNQSQVYLRQFPMLNIQPNPFKTQTAISYSLPANSKNPSLEIFDATGRLITSHKPLVTSHRFIWDGKDMNGREVKNGIYFCCLTSDNQTIKKRITVLR